MRKRKDAPQGEFELTGVVVGGRRNEFNLGILDIHIQLDDGQMVTARFAGLGRDGFPGASDAALSTVDGDMGMRQGHRVTFRGRGRNGEISEVVDETTHERIRVLAYCNFGPR
jgi:hypothetical protein